MWSRRVTTTGLLGGIFFLPLCLEIAAVLLVSAGLALIGRMVWTGDVYVRRTSLDPWMAGFVVLVAASAPGSIFAYESWYNIYHLFSLYILIYLLITQTVFSEQEGKRVVAAILTSALLVCAYGLMQFFVGVDVTGERWIDGEQFPGLKTRIFSTLGNPNVLAAFLVITAGLACGWGTAQQNPRGKILMLLITVLSATCIILTYSRGAWLAVGVMALIMAGLLKKPGWRGVLVILTVLAIILLFAQDLLATRLLSITGMFNSADSSVALRWALWESTIAMIQEHPWLGIGWGTYPYVYPYYDFFVQNGAVTIYHAHNTVLSMTAEIGIPGMLCFAVATGKAFWKMLQSVMQVKGKKNGVHLGLVLAMSGIAAFSLSDHVLFNIQMMAIFWCLLAVIASLPESETATASQFWFCKKFVGLAGFFSLRAK